MKRAGALRKLAYMHHLCGGAFFVAQNCSKVHFLCTSNMLAFLLDNFASKVILTKKQK